MTLRQYDQLTKQIKPDVVKYEKLKSIIISKREKYHRRRTYDPDATIDFINERNRRFNKKLDRFYGQYTEEIKQNLERGTAV
ncbi:unnamed protein product [Soboliphyme baturini]|uniref:Pre-mRNA-splicing factor SYF2 n=1 Tax=Soboliphyme baturini TaxID=241478 RepID=A0A183ITJ2_9BILA|nr:unnamed protein product [Soboliphyme baturini]